MWIRDVSVPQELVEAHHAGRLVIFVGAGASRASPAGLPDFKTLTEQVVSDAGITLTHEQEEQLEHSQDLLLGDLEDHHSVDVHARVALLLGVESSQPNALHQAIIALATTGPCPRVVTTNYDTHLTTVLRAQGLVLREYVAPALPMGDSFIGLVYLHGSLGENEPDALIVTDSDFGRAYLRDAWATRFLERMFATYTVLFVGYSHNDIVVSYLARALGPSSSRYAFTDRPADRNWRRLRIQPVAYQVADDSHEALVRAISGWADRASMGLLDHRQRVASLVATPPSQVPEEMSYLEDVLGDPETVSFFVETARGLEWLEWASRHPRFRALFDRGAAPDACSRQLGHWFTKHYAFTAEWSDASLRLLQESGGQMGPLLWLALAQGLHCSETPRPSFHSAWIVLLVQQAPRETHDLLEYALHDCVWPQDRDVGLLLFDHLTEPDTALETSLSLTTRPLVSIKQRGDDYWLRESWKALLLPNLNAVAPDVLSIVDHHVRRAHRLLRASGAASTDWDPLSYLRATIEPQGDVEEHGPLDVLIDAGRACLEALLAQEPVTAASLLIERWADSQPSLLRRLAVHGVSERGDVTADEKLRWLRARGWLFDGLLRHEVFRLLQIALPKAQAVTVDALVSEVLTLLVSSDQEVRSYSAFEVLAWMQKWAPGNETVRAGLARLRQQHPEYVLGPHPDVPSRVEVGWVVPQPPMPPGALHELIVADPRAAVAQLLQYRDNDVRGGSDIWEDTLGLVAQTVAEYPLDGLAILEANPHDGSVVSAVVRGWTTCRLLDREVALRIVNALSPIDSPDVADDVARLLVGFAASEATRFPWYELPEAHTLAVAAWRALEARPVDERVGSDWLGRAINSPVGMLAQFWVTVVSAEWRKGGDAWTGLPTELSEQLVELLSVEENRAALVEVIFASQLHFFHAADSDFCTRHVLPLLSWVDVSRATRNWQGFLSWGRPDDGLLSSGLLEHYLDAVAQVHELPSALQGRLSEHLAMVAVYSDAVPPETWVRSLAPRADDAYRASWLVEVAAALRRLSPDAVERQWRRWLHEYWLERVRGVPSRLTEAEASALSCVVVHLTESVQEGIDLALQRSAGLIENSRLLQDLSEDALRRAPQGWAMLLTHLLKGTQPPFYQCSRLRELVQAMRAEERDVSLKPLLEEALRLGCSSAPAW